MLIKQHEAVSFFAACFFMELSCNRPMLAGERFAGPGLGMACLSTPQAGSKMDE
jgi:hypothetical protein